MAEINGSVTAGQEDCHVFEMSMLDGKYANGEGDLSVSTGREIIFTDHVYMWE